MQLDVYPNMDKYNNEESTKNIILAEQTQPSVTERLDTKPDQDSCAQSPKSTTIQGKGSPLSNRSIQTKTNYLSGSRRRSPDEIRETEKEAPRDRIKLQQPPFGIPPRMTQFSPESQINHVNVTQASDEH